MSSYDLVIVGGGMVGLSLANALLPTANYFGLKIAIIEPAQATGSTDLSAHPSFDARATALSAGSRNIYQTMGFWQALERHVCPIETIHISDRGRFGATRLSSRDEGVDALGYVVENHWLGHSLAMHLTRHNQGQVELIQPATVTQVTATRDSDDELIQTLTVDRDGEVGEIAAQLVVLADGGRSSLKRQLGISDQKTPYEQHAVVAVVSPSEVHRCIAYERFTEQGPIALLPLPNHNGHRRYGLVWTISNDEIQDVLALDDAGFLQRLQDAFGFRAGHFTKVGPRSSYPLVKRVACEQVREGVVVLGNAAHTLHPIAGQGFNLALRGATELVSHVIDMCQQNKPLSDLNGLSQFAKTRQFDQMRTIEASEKMMQLFCNSNPAARLLRSTGLQGLDVCKPAKTVVARAAMGLDITAPNLNPCA